MKNINERQPRATPILKMAEEHNISIMNSQEGNIGKQSSDEDVPRPEFLTGPEDIYFIPPDFGVSEEDLEESSEEGDDDVSPNNAVERGRDMPSLSDDEFEDAAEGSNMSQDDDEDERDWDMPSLLDEEFGDAAVTPP